MAAVYRPEEHTGSDETTSSKSTQIDVRVIANDGKFLGDDIGGALITIRDVDTRELIVQGVTKGDSGPNGVNGAIGVMCVSQKRGEPIPTTSTTSVFKATIELHEARRIEVTAFGPLGARGSANTTSVTTWIYPGKDMTAGNGLLLEVPGLICQVINPPTHTTVKEPVTIDIVANVAMMCGCPISEKPADTICSVDGDKQPWRPGEFEVSAKIESQALGKPLEVRLCWDEDTKTAGRFTKSVPNLPVGIYQMTVVAHQKLKGNTGVDMSTFIIIKSS